MVDLRNASPEAVAWATVTEIERHPHRHVAAVWSAAHDSPRHAQLSREQQDYDAVMSVTAWVSHLLGWRHFQHSPKAVSVSGEMHTHADIARVALGLSEGDAAWLSRAADTTDSVRALRLIAAGLYDREQPLSSQLGLRFLPGKSAPAEVARAVLHALATRPEQHQQTSWYNGRDVSAERGPDCGTTMCVAGWAAMFTGWDLMTDGEGRQRARMDELRLSVSEAAEDALGLTDGQAGWMFASTALDILDGLQAIARGETIDIGRASLPATATIHWNEGGWGPVRAVTYENGVEVTSPVFQGSDEGLAYACQVWAAQRRAPLKEMRWRMNDTGWELVPLRFPLPPGEQPFLVVKEAAQ